MTEETFVKIIRENNGEIYIAGGWVRDTIAGTAPKDKDYVLCGITEALFCRLFPPAQRVGRAFPVYLLEISGRSCEIAFARKEIKQGSGYKGFSVTCNKSITIEEDLFRRDTRMNSIAMRLPEETIIDPFGGISDIKSKCIRATSGHFSEDPVRALRAARQAAEFDFHIEEGTLLQMAGCAAELKDEPAERIVNELTRALSALKPSVFFRYLDKAGLLADIFPELAALLGQIQPRCYHPEGDSFEHTMLILDTVSADTADIPTRFAALCHDLGKGLTPKEMLPHHYGHEAAGLTALKNWSRRTPLPNRWYRSAAFVIKEHMRAARLNKTGKIVDLLISIEKNPPGIDAFCTIIKADNKSLPYYLKDIHCILKLLHRVDISGLPAGLKGPQIAVWIRNQRIAVLSGYSAAP